MSSIKENESIYSQDDMSISDNSSIENSNNDIISVSETYVNYSNKKKNNTTIHYKI